VAFRDYEWTLDWTVTNNNSEILSLVVDLHCQLGYRGENSRLKNSRLNTVFRVGLDSVHKRFFRQS